MYKNKFLMSIILIFMLIVPALAAEEPPLVDSIPQEQVITVGGLENNVWMTKYGNVYCDCKAEEFVKRGFKWGDLVKMRFLDQELILPVVPAYTYVDSGKSSIIMGKNDTGDPTGYISFGINMGNFAQTYGMATKQTDETGNWWWTANDGVTFPLEITFELAESDGYLAEYLLRELQRTNIREDYANLSDEEFANFRPITTAGMGKEALYRSSSPINPELGRNTYADSAIKHAGVKTIINLADTVTSAVAYEGFDESYYAQQNVSYVSLGIDFHSADFHKGLAEGLRFMAEKEGPYLIHCTEGKDRAGFVSAVLECFMGASLDEVVTDYMVTYYNYYGVETGSEKYAAIAKSNIIKSLGRAFDVSDLAVADLREEAAEYIREIGLTDAEIAALRTNLSKSFSTESVTYVIVRGDTLSEIARKFLGDSFQWKLIYEANRDTIENPNLIYIGQSIVIPYS